MTPEFTLTPASADFGEMIPGESKKLEFTLTRNFGGGLELKAPTDLPPWVSVKLPAVASAPGGQKLAFSLDLTMQKSDGAYDTVLKLPVGGQVRKLLEVPVKAKALPLVALGQSDLFFGTVPAAQTVTKILPLRVVQGVAVTGLEAQTEAGYLKVELTPNSADKPAQVTFTLLPVAQQGPFSATEKLGFRLASGQTVQASVTCFGIRSE